MIVYLAVFQIFRSESVISNSRNPRLDLYEERVIRGDILSSDGVVLATSTVNEDGSQTRNYPCGRMFAHAVGYVNNGKGGLESDYNFSLLRSHSFFLTQLINDLTDQKSQGDSVVTTLNYEVQEAAYNALGSNDGAVVVLEPDTGKVLAMVSKPDYDPNTLAENWDSIVSDDSSSVLLNRATSGLYPPGSTFKIFTALEYIHENPDYASYSFDCEGELTVDGNQIHCYHNSVHGQQNLIQSFANSCNTSFANLGLTLNIGSFTELLESMMFNQELPGSLSSTVSRFTLTDDAGTGKIMQTAFGQGDTLVSPLHMALVAAAVENDGIVMTPYLVDHIQNDNGRTVRRYRSSEYGRIMSEEDAAILQEFMSAVVADGTATALSGQSYSAAGKTGSAEYDSEGNSHGWFVGYASKEGYNDIAIAVIVEDGFTELLESMMFNQELPGSLSSTVSRFTLTDDAGTGKIMQTAFGQGDTLVSPLHMALVAAAVENDGIVMTPYLVDHIQNDNGRTVRRYRSSEYGRIMSEEDAAILQEFMSAVVADGTATALSGQSYSAAGKTGSAEYDSEGNSHGWFVGYASKEGYNDIAIAVIVEDGDSGSKSAVPVAKAVFDTYFN